jgi:serine/threonine protein phosphatase 1
MPFLSQLKQLSVSGRVVFVHAGLDPDATLNNQPDQAALWGRTASGKPLGLKGFRTVHGHFAQAHPVSLRHRVCVDTGAYHSGRLTAVRPDHSEEFLQVVAAT